MRNVPLYRTLVPAAVRLDVQRQGPSGAPEGPGVGAPRALGQRDQRRPPRVLHPLHRVRSSATGPDLVEKVLPNYPPFGKRILLDNGWYAALRRDDVSLVTDPITSMTAGAVNGHRARRAGLRDGVRRRALPGADRDPRARRGRSCARSGATRTRAPTWAPTVPGFPNLFMVYGPNTQAGHGGSLIGIGRGAAALHHRPAGADARPRARARSRCARRSTRTTTGASTPRTSGWSGRTRGWRRTTATRAGGWSSRRRSASSTTGT